MKKLFIAMTVLFLSAGAFAQQSEILLDSKTINYGAVNQDTNAPANELIIIKRTSATPSKVKIKLSFNYMEKKCISYKVKVDKIKDFNQIVCNKNADGSHQCDEKEYSGLYNAKTVCINEGPVRFSKDLEVTLNFKSAVKLTEGAEETFQLNLKQKKSSSDKLERSAQTLNSASMYKITTSVFGTLKFKAQ
jgi:hypothetical protein